MVSKFETRFWEREKGRCRDVLEREREGGRERKEGLSAPLFDRRGRMNKKEGERQ